MPCFLLDSWTPQPHRRTTEKTAASSNVPLGKSSRNDGQWRFVAGEINCKRRIFNCKWIHVWLLENFLEEALGDLAIEPTMSHPQTHINHDQTYFWWYISNVIQPPASNKNLAELWQFSKLKIAVLMLAHFGIMFGVRTSEDPNIQWRHAVRWLSFIIDGLTIYS